MTDGQSLYHNIENLMEIEEERTMAGFIQMVEKESWKAWNDCNIHQKIIHPVSLVLLYDIK
jgi:hypothetical protein